MTGPQIKTQLDSLCAMIEKRLSDYEALMKEAQNDLVHLRYTIAMLQREDRTPNNLPTISVAGLFKRGEIYERCRSALEQTRGELATSDLVTICMEAKSMDVSDRHLRRAMGQMIIQVLQVPRGVVEIVPTGKRGVMRLWKHAKWAKTA